MFLFFEIAEIAAVETLLVSIPESAAVLAFGIVLATAAVLTRKLLDRGGPHEADEKAGKRA